MNHRQWKKNFKKKYGKNPPKELKQRSFAKVEKTASEVTKSLTEAIDSLKKMYYKMMESPDTREYMESVKKKYNVKLKNESEDK